MSVTVQEDLMAPGAFSVDIDYTPVIHDELTEVVDGKRRPRKNHALFYDPASALMYCGLVLSVEGDERGLHIGGRGLIWHLGYGDVGPMIADREYISGSSKLSNPSFDLDQPDLYWRRSSEDSFWLFGAGAATNAGGMTKDDVLESDEKFPTRPGNQYRMRVEGVSGAGRMRVRTLYEGRFDPSNLLVNPGFESGAGAGWAVAANLVVVASGARTGTYAMRVSPIPKPQLISNSGFESGVLGWTLGPTMTIGAAGLYEGTQGLIAAPNPKPQLISNGDFASGSTGWTLGSTFSVAGGALIASPNPQPQYISDSGFETGAGWTDVIGPSSVPMSDDIDIVNNPGEARGGSWVMQVGPITQHTVFANADFGNGLDNWVPSSTDAEPDLDIWDAVPGDGVNGTQGARTQGWAAAGRPGPELIKYLRADSINGSGVNPYAVNPGETYDAEAWFKGHPGTDGWAYISLMIPHPTVPDHDQWYLSGILNAPPSDDNLWERVTINNVTIPPNRFVVNGLIEVHDHTLGYWSADSFVMTRTRGNRAQINSNATYTVVPDTTYELAAVMRSGDEMQGGSVRIGVILSGAGMDDEIVDVDKGSTDFEWTNVVVRVQPKAGYTTARPFVAGHDISGEPAWIDNITFKKVSNNTDVTTHTPFAVVPDQRYLLSAAVTSTALQGDITVGVTLSGAGKPNLDVEVSQGVIPAAEGTKALSQEVRPPEGYTTATPYVRSKDILGGTFSIGEVLLTKADNNTDETTHSSFAIITDQRYLLSATVRSASAVTNGSVTVGLRLTGGGLPVQSVDVTQDITKGEWKAISQEVRAPSGYTTATPYIVTKDIEGGNFSVDNVTLTQSDNNSDSSAGTAIAVTPERSYRWLQAVRSGPALQRGTVKLSVTCTRTNKPDVVFDSSPMEATANTWHFIDFSFTPPSGYASVVPRIIGTDVEGDYWYLDDGDLRDTDTATMVFDSALDNPGGGWVNLDTTAPVGAEFVRVQLIVEEGATRWTVGNVSLARTGVTPATGNAIVADLLEHPETGDPLMVSAGTVDCPEVIPYDWHILNLTNRAALDHYCNVVSDPPREYKVNPNRTIDVGESADVFTDHSPDSASPVVLLEEDVDVTDLPSVESNVEERATHIQVIGAVRQTVSGQPLLITATAEVPGTTEVDWNGNDIVRTKQVHDATVDHFGYAQALADDLALREAEPALNLSATLTEIDTATATALGIPVRPAFDVGDWIYIYNPDAGLEDVDNVTTIEGQTVFPRRLRVLSRTRSLGPRYRVDIRRTNGTTFTLPGVLWSDADATSLVIGDRLADWQADPQGMAPGIQYLRDRASSPR